jgi:hypothetical protein
MKLKYCPENEEEYAGIELPDGRDLIVCAMDSVLDPPLLKTITHRVNNFDKALELLNKCYEILYSEYPEHDPRHPSQWGLDTGIEELERVET